MGPPISPVGLDRRARPLYPRGRDEGEIATAFATAFAKASASLPPVKWDRPAVGPYHLWAGPHPGRAWTAGPVDFSDEAKDFTPEGFLTLRVHNGKSSKVRWRALHVKEL